MRRFFSFKPSASSNTSNKQQSHSSPPNDNSENVHWESPPKDDARIPVGKMVYDDSKARQSSILRCLENDDSHISNHRRSASFSSPGTYSEFGEGIWSSSSRSPSIRGNPPHPDAECTIQCHSPTLERHLRTGRGDLDGVRLSHATQNADSPSSCRGHNCSSSSSAYTSPMPLRCRSARVQQSIDNNSSLDLYIDGEQHEIKEPRKLSQNYFAENLNDGCFAGNNAASCLGKPPRALSTAPSSPTYSQENLRTYSFREVEDFRRHLFTRDETDNFRASSPYKQPKSKAEKLLQAFRGKSKFKSRDCDSETTTTVEDIYVDSSDLQQTSSSTGTSGEHSMNSSLPYYGYCTEGLIPERQSYLYGKGSVNLNNENFPCSELLQQKLDEELIRKSKEVEEMKRILSDQDIELERLQSNTFNVSALVQMTRNIAEDRRNMVLELSSQLKSRIAERCSAREGLKQAKFEIDTRTRRLQQEKSELQSSLEKELDRRTTDWSLKLEKFQSEEQRLRDRVRELAEQNVSLQREISSIKGNEEETRSRIMDSEMQLNNLTTNLEELRTENHSLRQALGELQEHFNGAEEDLNCMQENYRAKEKENNDLTKVVIRLKKVCNDQEKTINGLRQVYSNEIGKQSVEKDERLNSLQLEQLRLTGVEQMLRKEVESSRNELESLRHENMCLLSRLQGVRNSTGFSSMKLDQELHDRVACLQTQGLSLLTEQSQFCIKLLDFVKREQNEFCQQPKKDIDGYLLGEYSLKFQSLRRGVDNFRRSLLTVPTILTEMSNIGIPDCHSQNIESPMSKQSSRVQASEDDLELELKAESLLTKLLREKLCSKELELEQLQSDFASSVRAHEILQTEIQRLQDELSCLTHKAKDMELQVIMKDERINQLHQDLQECTKELTATRSVLMTVSEERDHIWEEVKRSRETIMLLNLEVTSLKKKIEALDEHVLIKEGEISILRDTLVDKPFDIISSPKSVNDFCLE